MTPNKKSETLEKKSKNIPAILIIVILLAVLGGIALAAQDRFTLKSPNGAAFSDFKGYDTLQNVSDEDRSGDRGGGK